MALLIGEACYKVGVWEIDRQHRSLIELINQIYENVQSADLNSKLGTVFAATVDYAKNHFAFEESYLDRLGFEELPSHRRQHGELLTKLERLRGAFDTGAPSVNPGLVQLVKSWVMAHIQQCDQRYAGLAVERSQRSLACLAADE